MNTYYSSIILLTILSMIIMINIVISNHNLNKEKKTGFILVYSAIIALSLAEWFGVFLNGNNPHFILIHKTVKFIEFTLAPIVPYICAKSIFGMKENRSKVMLIILICHILIEFFSLFYGYIFIVDQSNYYHHALFYVIYLIVDFISLLLFFESVVKFSIRYQNRDLRTLIMMIIFILIGVGIQTTHSDIMVDWITLAIVSIFIFMYYLDIVSYMDGLTKLRNQMSYLNDTNQLNVKATILLFDVDNFKNINDYYGHQYGDHCLYEIASSIKRIYHHYGFCYRIGGDEFAVIMTKDENKLDSLNQNLIKLIDSKRTKDENLPHVSFGSASYNPQTDIITDVIERADQNMYSYKRMMKTKNN